LKHPLPIEWLVKGRGGATYEAERVMHPFFKFPHLQICGAALGKGGSIPFGGTQIIHCFTY